MARVQYINQLRSVNITKPYPIPFSKDLSQRETWWKAARKAIPEIPEIKSELYVMQHKEGWYLFVAETSETFVKFTLYDALDNKCYVVIDRSRVGGL